MAYYAVLDENNIVTAIKTAGDENDWDGEREWLAETGLVHKRTSYNTRGGVHQLGGTPFRKNYAGIDFTYDEARDAFVPPQLPYSTLNEDTCRWENNIPYPEIDADTPANQSRYAWDNLTLSWVKRTLPNL